MTRSKTFVAPLSHFANPPADPHCLAQLPNVPGVDAAAEFYLSHAGALLYTGRTDVEAGFGTEEGIEIFTITEWKWRTEQMAASWADEGYVDADMPYGRGDFVAIGHGRGASSYIHWVTRGPRAGAIFWWAWTMPPEPDTAPLAENFAAVVDLFCNDPVHLLNDLLGGYTRFSDGSLTGEWVPIRYLPDRSKV